MTQEEKAKRYDDALETARKINSGEGVPAPPDWTTYEVIFPELKESEDERIRKELIEHIKANESADYVLFQKFSSDDVIDWLEKQGNHADKIEPKFKNGQWIVFNGLTLYVNEVVQGYYRTTSIGGIPNSYDWNIDNAARLWTIQDAKDGDVLYIGIDGSTCIFKKLEGNLFYSYIISDGKLLVEDSHYYYETSDNVHPATKEQRDTLFAKMKEAGYEWNEEKKELKKLEKQGEQKPIFDFKSSDWYVSEIDHKIHNIHQQGKTALEAIHEDKVDNANKVKSRFDIGDFIVSDYCFGKVIEITNDAYLLDTGQGIPFSCEHNAHLWTIEDAKDGDVLAVDSRPFIYNGSKDEVTVGAYCGFNVKNRFSFAYNYVINQNIVPATKEQRDLLFSKIHEAGYFWDSENKQLLSLKAEPTREIKGNDGEISPKIDDSLTSEDENMRESLISGMKNLNCISETFASIPIKDVIGWLEKQCEQKPKWSEEDSLMIDSIIDTIKWLEGKGATNMKIDWLKSLKQRMEK